MFALFAVAALVLVFSSMNTFSAKYFTLKELTKSATAERLGINNQPSSAVIANLQATVSNVLDPLRDAIGKPVWVTSGYRSEKLNKAVNGAKNSDHISGRAVDFKIAGMTAQQIADRLIGLDLPFDKLIVYHPARGGHVHVSYRSGQSNRKIRLYAPESGGYVDA